MSMHVPKRCLIYWFVSLISGPVWGAERNPGDVFVTFAPNESTAPPWKEIYVQTAHDAKESCPAEQDPEGNWGDPVNGFQLSVRFEKKVFRLGEPITADVFLRNVGSTPLTRTFASGAGFDSTLCRFVVTPDSSEPLKRIGEQQLMSVKQRTLYPKAQWKCPVLLNEMFNMDTPGSYQITGFTEVGEPLTELRSATVVIQIVAQDFSERNAATGESSISSPAIPGRVQRYGGSTSTDATVARISPDNLKSASGSTASLNSIPRSANVDSFRPGKKVGVGIIAGLLAFLLAILWRAARRKRA